MKEQSASPVSMTGFGKGTAEGNGFVFEVEIKGVNHRFLEFHVRLPRELAALEERAKKSLQDYARRGRVEVFISYKETEEKSRIVKLDKELAQAYDIRLKEMADLLQTTYAPDVFRVASLPNVLSLEMPPADLDSVWPVLSAALIAAAQQFSAMRCREGRTLTVDLRNKLAELSQYLEVMAARAPFVVEEYRTRLYERLKLLAPETGAGSDIPAFPEIDAGRLAQEVALMADRVAIEEELVRLRSHLGQFGQALDSADAVGRKLDFVIQEMNREINTIGSKANDLTITQAVVNGKNVIEKLREQVQNLE